MTAKDPNFQEYPKMKYGPNGAEKVVHSEEAEKALKGWKDSPEVTGAIEDDAALIAKANKADAEDAQEDDIEALKKQAKSLEIDVHPNTGKEKLKELINQKRKTTEQ